jgi:hypothetical protein
MPAATKMPPALAKQIEDISDSLVVQLENLEGLCSTLGIIGWAKDVEPIEPKDFGRTIGVIAASLKDIREGVEHIESLAISNPVAPGTKRLRTA